MAFVTNPHVPLKCCRRGRKGLIEDTVYVLEDKGGRHGSLDVSLASST